MKKPDGWDSAQAYTGESVSLPAGGYICTIVGAVDMFSNSGKPMLVLLLDIAEGEYAGYFRRQFENAKEKTPEAKWNCVYRQLVEGKSLPFFKGLITSIEESNGSFKWNFDEKNLIGKKIGAIFGREQYVANDGNYKWSTKCLNIRSVATIKNGVEPPADKLISPISSVAPMDNQFTNTTSDFDILTDDDLPF